MREYGKVAPQFWTGDTGRQIRKYGRDCQVVAFYLLTCPSANMIGLYYLPLPVLMHEVGITKEGASKALRRLSEALFATYDEASEHVFVHEMASFQIGEPLAENDNRVKGIIREWQTMRKTPFYKDFHQRYAESFHLPSPSPFEAPCKPLRSQEQEQEQEQDIPPKSPKGEVAIEVPLELDTPEFLKAWRDWEAHRKGLRKPVTRQAKERQWQRLAKIGSERAVAAIDLSIEKGWQGIYEGENGHQASRPQSLFKDQVEVLPDIKTLGQSR